MIIQAKKLQFPLGECSFCCVGSNLPVGLYGVCGPVQYL